MSFPHVTNQNRSKPSLSFWIIALKSWMILAPSLAPGLFFKEFGVVGQFVVRAWIKVVSCRRHDMQWPGYAMSLPGAAGGLGALNPPVGPGQNFCGGPVGEAPRSSNDPAIHSTKKMFPNKNTFLVHFYQCAAYKLKGKIHLNWKNLCARQIFQPHARWTSRSASHGDTKHGRHNELTSFQDNHNV